MRLQFDSLSGQYQRLEIGNRYTQFDTQLEKKLNWGLVKRDML